MVHPVIYALRGWIAFVAFIEFSNSIRCFIDAKQMLITAQEIPEQIGPPLSRLMGRYCLLNAVVLAHCALCIEHIPIIVLTICSLSLTVLMYGSEAFYYYTASFSFYVVFPILISLFTIICLTIAPFFIEEEPRKKKRMTDEDEDDEDDYEMSMIKQKTLQQQQNSKHNIPNASRLKKTL
ncbi:unnamed protein product [Allacma fusca]|uniref:Uncharacterized protein n=1 Tax=Allacma fusca TaxID=39272 RepID=A0A8J2JNH9_9HEXA|nr:unnamed protein product [Allacma fusca]